MRCLRTSNTEQTDHYAMVKHMMTRISLKVCSFALITTLIAPTAVNLQAQDLPTAATPSAADSGRGEGLFCG